MANYIAPVNAPQPAARPVVDVGDIIKQASNAFQANKQGVLTRAILQQRADQERQNQARQDAQFQLEQQRFGMAQRQQQNQEQLHAAQLMGQGYEDVTGQPQTTSATGAPQQTVSIGDRQFRLNPANTPAAQKKADRLKKLQAYNDALPATDPKRLGASDIDMLANDDNLFNTFTTHRLGLANDPYETHKKERMFDIQNPLPTRSAQDPADKEAAKKQAWLLKRITDLMKPKKGRIAGMPDTPGLSQGDALKQATDVWNLVHGEDDPMLPQGGPQTSSLSPSLLAAHQKIDADLRAAVEAGANPQAAMERANQLHAQVR